MTTPDEVERLRTQEMVRVKNENITLKGTPNG